MHMNDYKALVRQMNKDARREKCGNAVNYAAKSQWKRILSKRAQNVGEAHFATGESIVEHKNIQWSDHSHDDRVTLLGKVTDEKPTGVYFIISQIDLI